MKKSFKQYFSKDEGNLAFAEIDSLVDELDDVLNKNPKGKVNYLFALIEDSIKDNFKEYHNKQIDKLDDELSNKIIEIRHLKKQISLLKDQYLFDDD